MGSLAHRKMGLGRRQARSWNLSWSRSWYLSHNRIRSWFSSAGVGVQVGVAGNVSSPQLCFYAFSEVSFNVFLNTYFVRDTSKSNLIFNLLGPISLSWLKTPSVAVQNGACALSEICLCRYLYLYVTRWHLWQTPAIICRTASLEAGIFDCSLHNGASKHSRLAATPLLLYGRLCMQ